MFIDTKFINVIEYIDKTHYLMVRSNILKLMLLENSLVVEANFQQSFKRWPYQQFDFKFCLCDTEVDAVKQ